MDQKMSAMDETLQKLQEGVRTLFTGERYQEYLRTMAKFSHYSFNNTVLIASQRPDATLVAGYRAWKDKFGRQVKRGEKGIRIITPVKVKETREVTVTDPVTHRVRRGPDGKPLKELREVTIPRFKVATVFDISQTEGPELPTPEVTPLTQSVPGYEDLMEAICRISPVPVTIEPVEGENVNGFYHHVEKRIAVKEGMSQAQTVKTALHEVTHALLHDRDMLRREGIQKDPHSREIEAESVAYTVSQAFGLDTSDYTFGYIASWSTSVELAELRQAMDTVRRTSLSMIDSLQAELRQIQRQQALHHEDPAVRIDALMRVTDYYGYTDAVEEPEENIGWLQKCIRRGDTRDLREYLSGVIATEPDPALAEIARKTMEELPEPEPVDVQLGNIRYFVAENMLLPVSGRYVETDSLEDAKHQYDELPAGSRNGIGAILYDDTRQRDVPLLVGGVLQRQVLEDTVFQKDGKLHNAMRDLDGMLHPEQDRPAPSHIIGKGEMSR